MCPRGRPRGQGRSRGPHLWLILCLFEMIFITQENIQLRDLNHNWYFGFFN